MTKISTLRPGLLVSLKTSLTGNVHYERRDLDARRDEHEAITEWETKRTIADIEEYERGKKAQSKAGQIVRRPCAPSAFGLLCPEANADLLERAIADAREEANRFNATAQLSRLSVNVIVGRVAADDVEAVKAINSEVRDLLSLMETGLAKLDVKAVRDAADKAKALGQMLSPDAAGRVQVAIDAAREAAKRIVKAGEQGAAELDEASVRRITEMRLSFLDLDEAKPVAAVEAQGRAVDLTPEEPLHPDIQALVRVVRPQLEIE